MLTFYMFSGFYLFFSICLFLGFCLLFYCGGYMVQFIVFSFGGWEIVLSFVFDYLSLGFFSCVSFIAGMVFFYSVFYMGGGFDLRRFSFLVFLFVVSMFLLVFSGSFFSTMVGWDGLGLVSFCLVVYYNNSSSLDSGLVTVFSNRVGDVFFLLSFYFFSVGGLWSFDFFSFVDPVLFVFFLFFGAITKSAQVPFSAWLPAAMAAPTPVSSLVHSSTLVTAGIYVLIRFHYLLLFYSWFFKVFSLVTMLLAGACACLEKDYKKVIAMSTLSQLGMMLFIMSVGSWVLSFLHMVIHAFFKSTLFLSSGMLISQEWGGQDSRIYGGFTFGGGSLLYFFVSCLSLAGFPFVIGFYSKDQILSSVSAYEGGFYFFVFVFGCFLTVFYSVRLFVSGFMGFCKSSSHVVFSEDWSFFFPVYFLFLLCTFGGGWLSWFFVSDMSVFFRGVDFFLGLFVILMGIFFYGSYLFSFYVSSFLGGISFLRWLSSGGVSRVFGGMFFYKGDAGWIELVGGQGFFSLVYGVGGFFSFFFKLGLKSMLFLSILGGIFFL
uniref:NADH dehydrogenase subunit 5 n=1 Tax=Allonothrus sinicus TaxID=3138099 RepID=UPI00315DEB27